MQTSPRPSWYAPGDLSAFFALALDNLSNLVLLSAILVGGFGFPAEVFLTKMVPGTALGVLVGDLAYTALAIRLARRTGRADVTAMPLGLDTPSTVGMAVAVLGPTWLMSQDAIVTWQVGMATLMLMGVVKVLAAFAGETVRRRVPGAGLLGSIGGVGLVLLGFLPLLHVFEAPIAGLVALGVVLSSLIARLPLPGRAPGALVAVGAGTALWYLLGAAGLVEGFAAPVLGLALSPPRPTLGFLAGLDQALDFLPLAIPFALLTIVGGINVTESARVAGDDYDTRDILLIEAGATLVAALFGGVAQSTPYIGHPAYKAMGARSGYTLASGLFVGLGGALGLVQFITSAIPAAAVAPLLIFVGVEIVSQAYQGTPSAHAPAVTIAFLPSVAELVRIVGGMFTGGAPAEGGPARFAHQVDVLAHGFIITGMLWGAIVVALLEGRRRQAAGLSFLTAGFVAFGLVHSVLPTGALYLPWAVDGHEHLALSAAYVAMGLVFLVGGERAQDELGAAGGLG